MDGRGPAQLVHPHGRPADGGGQRTVGLAHRDGRLDLAQGGEQVDDVLGERGPERGRLDARGRPRDRAQQRYDDPHSEYPRQAAADTPSR